MRNALQGRRALVTGGSRGIGLAIVEALAVQGADVVFTARAAGGVAGAMAALPSGSSVRGVVCDVTDRAGMAGLLAEPVDILVNNAGVIRPIGRLAEIDMGDWAENLRVNVVAAVSAIQLALPGLVARRGTVINLSSGAAQKPMEGWSAYCAGKAALAMVTRCLHLEYGGKGLRAFGFAPGLIDTDMQGEIRQSGINPVSALPRAALRPAAEPGRAIAWLCTPDADEFVGQELDIRTPDIRSRSGLEPLT
jgi:NAD(P)-dependent dehydrogenase (short-subunit alcohol dehydrogenase family)